ncbi:testis-specific serine/threonine-protein kinase 5-like isoform X3 [Mauremys reevesii]|uniref:testis-specific serine/threonine-protein kinase 5-like isoform X3 n=1 Tax=Mauremys reevesii TaxID=260615 RepID=UPI00193F1BD1|nr:testis-specific serine/threonine-protein kinase 5-like isoform X3 [Mauremys reevesii]
MKSCAKREADRKTFMEQVRESKENGYLLSSRKIGSGAFSKVYLGYATQEKLRQNYKLASDLRSKRHSMVAIKIISTAKAPLEYSRKFLPREIYSLNATYKHINVIQLYEMYRNNRRTYLVLELASRGDLLEHINATSDRRECPGLEEEEARRLFRQIVSAVAHCHNVGIVHRDLKCENILLDERGFIKLTDFGFANRYSLKNSLMSTFCGSVAYTAPEILMSKKYNGELADLWSLGVILYAMVTGKLPFKERQPHKMIHMIKQGLSFRQPISPGESGGSVSLLPDLESSAKPPEGAAKGTKAPAGPRASSAQDAFPGRAEMEAKAPELISAGCLLQLPSPCQAERPPRFSLYRPCLLSSVRPFHHLPNFRKPGSATSASAYVASRRLGERSPPGAAALGSGSPKPVISLHSTSMIRKPPPEPITN